MIILIVLFLILSACSQADTPGEKQERTTEFVKGSDISWTTEMESYGMQFYNSAGQERECTALMKEIGFEAIRLRVWVNPEDGWCSKNDVLAKAKRAHTLGMDLMIDFHYSDSWADPGKQTPPAAWSEYNATEMTQAVTSHTKDILQTLKDNGIDVRWVQIGNEVNQGMLWPMGKVDGQSVGDFVNFLNAGHNAVKRIYPEAKVILHVSNGHDSDLFKWFFGLMRTNKAKYDIIGMSIYPIWWENGGWCNWRQIIDNCISNISTISSMFSKPVMICETGMPVHEPMMSRTALEYLMDEAYKVESCMGIFYWEPEAPKGYNGGYEMGAFSDGSPTIALDPIRYHEK